MERSISVIPSLVPRELAIRNIGKRDEWIPLKRENMASNWTQLMVPSEQVEWSNCGLNRRNIHPTGQKEDNVSHSVHKST